jgi:hypothetical protein
MPSNPGKNSARYQSPLNSSNEWSPLAPAWDPTTVGSNGGPSYYGTHDQTGNVEEIIDIIASTSSFVVRGGGVSTDGSLLSKTTRRIFGMSSQFSGDILNQSNIRGLRISTINNPNNYNNFIIIGDSGNLPDISNGYGGVNYNYSIGKYEITNSNFIDFLNSVAKTDYKDVYRVNIRNTPGGL